jgi:hypothetical protein
LGSAKKVWWICHDGKHHKWQTSIFNRTARTRATKCPICANRQISKDYSNSVWTQKPDLRVEWHPTKNDKTMKEYSVGSNTKVWWKHQGKCGQAHEWLASINSRARKGSNCPVCANKKICMDLCNSLWALRPDLRKEWHPTKNHKKMTEVTPCSGKKVWWQCSKGHCGTLHEYMARICDRTRPRSTGCPICANRQICPDLCNSLWASRPDLRPEWHAIKNNKPMTSYSVGSNARVWWLCNKCNMHYQTSIAFKTKARCPYCLKQKKCMHRTEK